MIDSYPFDLGRYVWPTSTAHPQAQIWFDRGLNWLYGFNHEEAVNCFQRATALDPGLGIAWWGIAYASGPFYNMPWRVFTKAEQVEATKTCFDAAVRARACLPTANAVEAALIKAIGARYGADHPVSQVEFDRWDLAYADAMRATLGLFPDNLDIIALCAEAVMTLTPWQLWHVHSGEVAKGAATLEALSMLTRGIALAEQRGVDPHQALLHLHIHVLEMSDHPERALESADRLQGLSPDAGHLEHMPGHIYVLCGMYHAAIECSWKAIEADRKYLKFAGPFNFYTTARCHDLHLLMYSAMMAGCFEPAIAAADEIMATLSPEVLRTKKNHMAITMEGYFATKLHVLVRFGRWQQIVEMPLPKDPELYCVTTAMHHYARGVAFANLKDFTKAAAAQTDFLQSLAAMPEDRLYFNNQARDILAVGEAMLAGELAYHQGQFEPAFAHLREAARRDDFLYYTEPWAWMHPPRHALGALLLEQGHVEEAEAVYRADLGYDQTLPRCCQHPENIWALHGFTECLGRLGKDDELVFARQRLDIAVARADTEIMSSCCCRGGN